MGNYDYRSKHFICRVSRNTNQGILVFFHSFSSLSSWNEICAVTETYAQSKPGVPKIWSWRRVLPEEKNQQYYYHFWLCSFTAHIKLPDPLRNIRILIFQHWEQLWQHLRFGHSSVTNLAKFTIVTLDIKL